MASLFKAPKVNMPPPPKPVRMPNPTDDAVNQAALRARSSALRRPGSRLSTIMTDSLGETVGSSGSKLGA